MKNKVLPTLSAVLIIACVFLFVSCTGGNENGGSFYDEYPTGDEIETVEVEKNPTATVTLTDGAKIEIELHYETAPNAVTDFIVLAKEGVYDSMAFNEVRNNCIVMLGSAEGEFTPPYYVKDEINEGENKLSHTKGVVSMIRTSDSDTLTGQFFILTKDQTHFDSRFTSFGTVISGMEKIEEIAAAEKDDKNKLVSPYVIKSVKVDTYGVKFPNPTIIPIENEE